MTEQENLIRQAIAAQADQAVDPAVVLDRLREGSRPRWRSFALVAAAGVAVAAAVVAVVVPLTAAHDAPAPAGRIAVTSAPVEQNILFVGLDRTPYADAILLARLDTNGSVRAVSLPRDVEADLPGQAKGKLNSVYANARQAALDQGRDAAAAGDEGMKALVGAVQQLTGVHADHYASIDMAGFESLSNAIGGVEVCLKAATHDPITGADFPAGKQTLSGERALAFLRQRHGLPVADLSRIARQQVFFRALVTKLATAGTLRDPKLMAELLSVVHHDVQTDQGWDLVASARQLAAAPAATLATIPIDPAKGVLLGVDLAQVRSFVGGFLSGTGTGTPAPNVTGPPGDCVN
jgi:LCP family protein required for cell wall assembly